jgi:hypothetical protein
MFAMVKQICDEKCSMELLNAIAPKIVASVSVLPPTLAIQALGVLSTRNHPEAISLAMQLETYWLTPKDKRHEAKPFGGGIYCPMRPLRDFDVSIISQLSESDRNILKKALSNLPNLLNQLV